MAATLMEEGVHLVTGGTDNHLMLIDLSMSLEKDITGKEAEAWLDLAGITVNKNTVPKEKRSPFITSGIRVGTPALTTRGLGVAESKQIAKWIAQILKEKGNATTLEKIRKDVAAMCAKYPVEGWETRHFL
jgi:glycine hydroxymethyltransferase